MKRKWLWITLLLVLAFAVTTGSALAQSYSFAVDSQVIHVYWNQDGTTSIDYLIEFNNDSGAHAIDFVDLGLPNSTYRLKDITADVNGVAITDISKADPQNLSGGSDGITLALGANAIPAGQKGTVHVFVPSLTNLIYPYEQSDRSNYASVNFIPNYFGSAYVHGKTDMTVVLHLPQGVQKAEEPVYYDPKSWPGPSQPESGFGSDGRIYYLWHSTDADSSTAYTFGAAFPAQYVPENAIVKAPAITFNFETLCCWGIALLFGGFTIWGIYQGTVGAKKRKLQYLPPKISIEGNGIKRGLTAVEAAVLMEEPLDKVLTMILFGSIKKNAAKVTTREPLEIEVTEPLPDGLQTYEREFLLAFKEPAGTKRKAALKDMMINLVKSLSEKMKGFSRKETIDYYKDIMRRAWEQVETADTPEVKGQRFDEVLEWTMLDKDFGGHTTQTFGSGPVFVPMWWGHYDPTFHPTSTVHTGAPVSTGSGGSGNVTVNLPTLPGSQFAASMVNGVQGFAAGVLGDLAAFTGGVTNATNPIPKPTATSSSGWHGGGGGGGHSCACACACAGCACACAGGGR
jgi:hypothetical protein